MNSYIAQGDCLELMKKLPDKSVDLILTDPPYGKKADRGTNGFGSAKNRRYAGGWDGKIPEKEYFSEMFRVAKNVVIFGGNYFCHLLPPSAGWIFWDKKGDIKFQNPFADGELIYTSFKGPLKKIVFKQQGFITDSKDVRYHPTQKPSELVVQIIEKYSNPGDLVLDPFLGSGTTAVAAIRTGRRYIGFELDPNYFEIAQKRINKTEEEYKQCT
jgi:site-specific DNA-methyltransferase (adenine-specific)